MIYQFYPEKCLPTELSPSGAQFSDGVYMDWHNIDSKAVSVLKAAAPATTSPFSFDLPLVHYDQNPPLPSTTYLGGRRRVRAPNVTSQCSYLLGVVNQAISVSYTLSLVVIRQGSEYVLDRDNLATVYGNILQRISQAETDYEADTEDLNIVYPGFVDLESGDYLVLRVTGQAIDVFEQLPANTNLVNLSFTFTTQAFVKFC